MDPTYLPHIPLLILHILSKRRRCSSNIRRTTIIITNISNVMQYCLGGLG
ncbi:hypothetical protein BVRB_5g113580 [Beta vulgaris subsp. vulgaris]|uniref:Uncharacterized protein n=1 Tax=Beta vulgaris subsp. vulgaris TaxID=3555 RepID=A0A0J8CAR1_BETVV|nr:hypothetical protein BVRB_5g113580 [Beta vulgaris subsp. vulgaris]